MENIKAADNTTSSQVRKRFYETDVSRTYKEIPGEQIKIEELQSTIDKAARELKELREMGEKK